MLFSIVIPVYNVENYLTESITSVLQQTYNDYEILLVDDGSVDSSVSICDDFSERYPDKIKVIHKSNEGVFLARNEGIKQASGKIIVFMDADDCLRHDALMLLNTSFKNHNCDMIIYNASDHSDFSGFRSSIPFTANECLTDEDRKTLYTILTRVSYLNSLCLKAVRVEVARLLLEYPEWSHVANGEDLLCTLPLITASNKIVYLNQALYYYRKRPGSTVHSFSNKKFESLKTVHQVFEKYIDLWGMSELHPVHYAREVRGWINATIHLIINNGSKSHPQLRQLARDTYFLNAYASMDKKQLSVNELLLAGSFYNRCYILLYIVASLKKFRHQINHRK